MDKIILSEVAVIKRINRKIKHDGLCLRKSRARYRNELGDFYLIDVNRNVIDATGVDIEVYGRELSVISPWEELDKG
jgi:N-acetylglutamate synthase-like GNAT family acetyltransferase